ncbi:hypothetical protein [Lysinibacillus sphaericus]|uniref:hypothetical protein n=1 Tax=Lysinibacillus sphaericus TaxID=1421 RepID=UPI001CBE2F78|nr:hypothetical protein [Lysinibacillus sphaericus]
MTNIGAVADAAFALRFRTKKHLLPQAAHRTPQGSFALCESEASATMFYLRESEASAANVLSARKRSVSGKCFICAKAKRQRQMFYLRESEASAANVLSARKRSVSGKCFICAKAKRQRQMFYLRESEASAANVLSARKRSVSGKAPSRNGNQPHVLVKSQYFVFLSKIL